MEESQTSTHRLELIGEDIDDGELLHLQGSNTEEAVFNLGDKEEFVEDSNFLEAFDSDENTMDVNHNQEYLTNEDTSANLSSVLVRENV